MKITENEYRDICADLNYKYKQWNEEYESKKNYFESWAWWSSPEQKKKRKIYIDYWLNAKATYERKR